MATSKRPPLSPKEGWLSDGRHVLHFRPTHWDRWSQRLELITGELLPGQPVPLLLVDESAFVQRFGATSPRRAERRRHRADIRHDDSRDHRIKRCFLLRFGPHSLRRRHGS